MAGSACTVKSKNRFQQSESDLSFYILNSGLSFEGSYIALLDSSKKLLQS